MKRFIEGEDRSQSTLFPEHLDDYIAEDNPVRVIDVFVDELDLNELGFEGMEPEVTGRPAYHPASLLKIYIYGYLNRIQSSRRLERESQRNVELIWLTGRLTPDFKTIADFRKDNGKAIRNVCREFVLLCRDLKLFSDAIVAIDGSKFKAVNNRDKNFTDRKLKARMQQLEDSIARYMTELDRADREPALVTEARVEHIKEKMETVKKQMRELKQIGKQMAQAPDGQISLTDPDARSMATSGRGTGMVGYNVQTAVDTKHHLIVAYSSDRGQGFQAIVDRAPGVGGDRRRFFSGVHDEFPGRRFFSRRRPAFHCRSFGSGNGPFRGSDSRSDSPLVFNSIR
jgi:transposase